MTDAELVEACAAAGHTPLVDDGCRCGERPGRHRPTTDPAPAPGISEERLAEIEATLLDGEGPSPPTYPWVNGAIDAIDELLAEVRRLRQQVERYESALRYCACPTMGYHGRTTPSDFAVNEATDSGARIALRCCIDTATIALRGSSHG